MAAPVAHSDDVWPSVGDFSMVADHPLKGRVSVVPMLLRDDVDDDRRDLREGSLSSVGTGAYKSIEDMVNHFDVKLSVCFPNNNAETSENIVPVDVIAEDMLQRDE